MYFSLYNLDNKIQYLRLAYSNNKDNNDVINKVIDLSNSLSENQDEELKVIASILYNKKIEGEFKNTDRIIKSK
jgi:hypothetical protein